MTKSEGANGKNGGFDPAVELIAKIIKKDLQIGGGRWRTDSRLSAIAGWMAEDVVEIFREFDRLYLDFPDDDGKVDAIKSLTMRIMKYNNDEI